MTTTIARTAPNVGRRILLGLAAMLAVFGLTLATSTPAEAATFTRTAYCQGFADGVAHVDIRSSSRSVMTVEAYGGGYGGKYLGSQTHTGYRLAWQPTATTLGDKVYFRIVTGVTYPTIKVGCGLWGSGSIVVKS